MTTSAMQPLGRQRTKPARPMSTLSILRPRPDGSSTPSGATTRISRLLCVGGLEHDHGQADIGAVFRRHALDQRALLGFGAGRSVAADLPIFMHRFDRALRERLAARRARAPRQAPPARTRRGGQAPAADELNFPSPIPLSVAPIGPLARGESPVLPAHSMSSRRRVPARSGRSAGASPGAGAAISWHGPRGVNAALAASGHAVCRTGAAIRRIAAVPGIVV